MKPEQSDVFNEAFWEERYRAHGSVWSGNPNPQLVREAGDLPPGSALDVGCGEGADAIWLAEHGWHVTATDFSIAALERGAAKASERGADVAGRITWHHTDLTAWVPTAALYDLVSAQFLHLLKEPREAIFRRLAAAVAPGGTLLIVGHHPSESHYAPAPPAPRTVFHRRRRGRLPRPTRLGNHRQRGA